MMKSLKKLVPVQVKMLIYRLRRMFVYNQYDSSAYWRSRASDPGQAAVLWKNQQYNDLYRKLQYDILCPHVQSLPPNAKILDVGCGIGIVSEMLLTMSSDIVVDAVDFPEMITIAKKRVSDRRVQFIEEAAESYFIPVEFYDLVLSSGCYSAIRDIAKLEMAIANGARMLKPDGMMLLIDPFHRWNYLARAKYGTRDVVRLLNQYNLELQTKSGVLFWPFREWLANSAYSGDALETRFNLGERLLSVIGRHLWADYKILIFKKTIR